MLTELAEMLDLKDVRASSYLLALADLNDREERATKEAKRVEKAMESSTTRSKELHSELQDILAVKNQLEEAVIERERHGTLRTLSAFLFR